MENFISIDAFSSLLAGTPFLQYLLDLLRKSSLVIAATYLIATAYRCHISNNGSHLLWLNSMLCVALLPFAAVLFAEFSGILMEGGPVNVITIESVSTSSAQSAGQSGMDYFSFVYSAVVVLLLLKLFLSAIALKRIDNDASSCTDDSILIEVKRICLSLNISRAVKVKLSEDVSSPMSYGLFKPVVALPVTAADWSRSTLEDVLIHELSHIKRLDWLTMLFCHLLTSVFWINPLVWFAKRRVDEAAEQSCDAAVLRHGKDGINYAEDLLRLARESLVNRQAPVLAQPMFDEGSLSLRIRNILSGDLIGKVSKKFIGTLLLAMVLVLGACSGVNLFGSKKYDGEILPTLAAPPQYPRRAAERGIEGWALVEFTVSREGSVAENSIKVIDAEPKEIFDRSSIRAAEKFEFEPPLLNGRPTDIEGVQYVFRYNLEPGGYQPEGQRLPPPARSNRN